MFRKNPELPMYGKKTCNISCLDSDAIVGIDQTCKDKTGFTHIKLPSANFIFNQYGT